MGRRGEGGTYIKPRFTHEVQGFHDTHSGRHGSDGLLLGVVLWEETHDSITDELVDESTLLCNGWDGKREVSVEELNHL